MEIKDWLSGVYHVEISSADPQMILNKLSEDDILIRQVRWIDDITVVVWVSNRGWSILNGLSDKGYCTVRIIGLRGIIKYRHLLLRRLVLVVGLISFIVLSIYLQNHILFVEVRGNTKVGTERIISKAEEYGLQFGVRRKTLRSEYIKNRLLEDIPELQWAGVDSSGCVATVCVKERTEQPAQLLTDDMPASIVASRDGTVYSVTSVRGETMCQVGQDVTAGQTLISGLKNCGNMMVYTRAEGEVYAQTVRELTVVKMANCNKREKCIRSNKKFDVIFGKNIINFYKGSGILDTTCVKIERKYSLMLPGGYVLPVSLLCTSENYYHITDRQNPQHDAWLLEQSDRYIKRQMIAGEVLAENPVAFSVSGVCGYRVFYDCKEMIGQIKKEEFLING